MKNSIHLLLAALYFCFFSSGAYSTEHLPEFSIWKLVSEYDCEETYRFRGSGGSGTLYLSSGELELVEDYLIRPILNTDFWEFKTVVTESNSKLDCLGNVGSKVGRELVLYMTIENTNEMHFYLFPNEADYLDIYLKKVN